MSPPLALVSLWLPLLGPTISNKQRIQRWITVGVKSIAAGLPGTAIDYESVLVSRTPWWRKGIGRQREKAESEIGRGGKKYTDCLHENNAHSCYIMLNIRALNDNGALRMMAHLHTAVLARNSKAHKGLFTSY